MIASRPVRSQNFRDEKLYNAGYRTFAEYCRVRWQMERTFAYRLINASEVVGLLPMGNISPANERVARPLTKLLPEPEVVPKTRSEAVRLPDTDRHASARPTTVTASPGRFRGHDVLILDRLAGD